MKIIERSLQELGQSLYVSLPKDWANTYKLKKGSKIKMMSSDQGLLTIAPEFTKPEKHLESELEYDTSFQRKFFHEYFNGNEKITINIKGKISEDQRKNLYLFLKRFITIQIVEESSSKIVLKSFKVEELSIEECMKRLYFLSLGMIEEVLASSSKTILKEIRDNMTRFYYLLVMQIRRFLDEGKFTKENQITLLKAMDYRMVAEKIQRVGEIMFSIDEIKDKELRSSLEKVQDHYSRAVLAFINSNYDKAPSLWEKGNALIKEGNRIVLLKKDLKIYSKARDIHQVLRYANEIAGLIRE